MKIMHKNKLLEKRKTVFVRIIFSGKVQNDAKTVQAEQTADLLRYRNENARYLYCF
jgi:hypothetical protein